MTSACITIDNEEPPCVEATENTGRSSLWTDFGVAQWQSASLAAMLTTKIFLCKPLAYSH